MRASETTAGQVDPAGQRDPAGRPAGHTDGRTARANEARAHRTELIYAALEELLLETPLQELGVDRIAKTAGITRAQFYSYFKSKYEVLAALLEQVAGEVLAVYDLPDSWFVRPAEVRPLEAMVDTHRRMAEVWAAHGAAVREASDMWNAVPEVRDCWLRIMSGLVKATSVGISRERERGVAPEGPPADDLAWGLVWQGERLLFLTLSDADGGIAPDDLARVSAAMWMRSIYLADDPTPL